MSLTDFVLSKFLDLVHTETPLYKPNAKTCVVFTAPWKRRPFPLRTITREFDDAMSDG